MSSRKWMAELGDEFWDSPASASGFHHGETQREHADEVFRLACRHWRRVEHEKIRKDRSIRRSFLRAAKLHDAGKKFDRGRHDIEGYRWLLEKGDDLAAAFVLAHMGRWASRGVRDIIDKEPVGRFFNHPSLRRIMEILQACDYTAACCHDASSFVSKKTTMDDAKAPT